jgi:hypothetical protein
VPCGLYKRPKPVKHLKMKGIQNQRNQTNEIAVLICPTHVRLPSSSSLYLTYCLLCSLVTDRGTISNLPSLCASGSKVSCRIWAFLWIRALLQTVKLSKTCNSLSLPSVEMSVELLSSRPVSVAIRLAGFGVRDALPLGRPNHAT